MKLLLKALRGKLHIHKWRITRRGGFGEPVWRECKKCGECQMSTVMFKWVKIK